MQTISPIPLALACVLLLGLARPALGQLPAPGDGFTWERVGDRPIDGYDLAFGSDSTLWAAASRTPHRLDTSAGFPGTWIALTNFGRDILPLGRGIEGDTLVLSSSGSVRRSLDGGQTWTTTHDEGGLALYEVPAGYPFAGRILSGDVNYIAYSTDRAASFTAAVVPGPLGAQGGGEDFVALPPDAAHPGRILAAGTWGVNVSDDGGATFYESALWQAVYYHGYGIDLTERAHARESGHRGGRTTATRFGVVERADGGYQGVVVGSVSAVSDARVWASADDGLTWDAGAGGAAGLDLAEGPPNNGRPRAMLAVGASSALAVLRGGTVYRTDDAGLTWAPVGRAPDIAIGRTAEGATIGPDGRLYVALLEAGIPDAWVYRTAERVTAAVAALAPVRPADTVAPLTLGPAGGSFRYAASVTNTTTVEQTFDVWLEASGPVSPRTVAGPFAVTLGPGETVRRTLTQRVPAAAPAGTYRYALKVGRWPGSAWRWSVISAAGFTFVKAEGSARGEGPSGEAGEREAEGDGAWSVSGWGEAAPLNTEHGVQLGVSPNPSRGVPEVVLMLAAPSVAEVSVYDVLGRRVAVLHEGPLDAGPHVFALDTAALPAGVYVVRVVAGGGVASRRVTVLR